eukprot:2883530-Rhodomonas_salina.1
MEPEQDALFRSRHEWPESSERRCYENQAGDKIAEFPGGRMKTPAEVEARSVGVGELRGCWRQPRGRFRMRPTAGLTRAQQNCVVESVQWKQVAC